MESALSYQSCFLFEEMMAQGLMRQADASIMALQFFAPIFLLLNQYDGIPEKEAEALEILGRHIEQFDQIYRKGWINENADRVRHQVRLYPKMCGTFEGTPVREVCLQNAKSYRGSLKEYDAVFIGGSVYMGKIRGEVSHFAGSIARNFSKSGWGCLRAAILRKKRRGSWKHCSHANYWAMLPM